MQFSYKNRIIKKSAKICSILKKSAKLAPSTFLQILGAKRKKKVLDLAPKVLKWQAWSTVTWQCRRFALPDHLIDTSKNMVRFSIIYFI